MSIFQKLFSGQWVAAGLETDVEYTLNRWNLSKQIIGLTQRTIRQEADAAIAKLGGAAAYRALDGLDRLLVVDKVAFAVLLRIVEAIYFSSGERGLDGFLISLRVDETITEGLLLHRRALLDELIQPHVRQKAEQKTAERLKWEAECDRVAARRAAETKPPANDTRRLQSKAGELRQYTGPRDILQTGRDEMRNYLEGQRRLMQRAGIK